MDLIFSFDDGRADSYSIAFPILKKNGLRATFHVVTGFVDGTFASDCFGIGRRAVSVQELQIMQGSGMEISSHGDKHVMAKEDFELSLTKLKKWRLATDKIGFSIPNSSFSSTQLQDFIKTEGANLLYIRAGRNRACYSFANKVHYLNYHLFYHFRDYRIFNEPNILGNQTDIFCLSSMVIKRDSKLNHLLKFLKMHQSDAGSLILMFHSIVDRPEDPWEWGSTDFEKLCEFVSANRSLTCKTLQEEFGGDKNDRKL